MKLLPFLRSFALCFLLLLLPSIAEAQLIPDFNQFFEQDQEEIEGGGERGNQFGAALAMGDFNGDGFDDLAVGLPGEDGGSVIVINGTADGLSTAPFPEGNKRWRQDQDGLPDNSENEDSFGFELAAGDFNGDGFDDLAVGAPGENNLRGAIFVINGSANGLTGTGSRRWRQGEDGDRELRDDDDPGDLFGIAMASGDFDGNGFDDLAVGVPGENTSRGVVNVIYGSNSGLTDAGNQRWRQGDDRDGRLEGGREDRDGFGSDLAAGDFNGDGFDDLAVGVPGENGSRGAVNVIYGSSNRLTDVGNQRKSQQDEDENIVGGAEGGNGFGAAVSAADFNADGFDDLAVGMPGEDGGSVIVFYGSSNRLTSQGIQRWRQGDNGILDEAEGGNGFGSEVAGGDFDGNGFADLAVGVPGEDDGQGGVHAIYGSPNTLITEGNQFFKQDLSNPEDGDNFSSALAAGDFNDDGAADLAIGVPGENGARGAVNVIYGSLPFAITNGASFFLGPVAPGAIVSMFGEALASGTFSATSTPLPTTLGGTTIEITDSSGITRPSPLFFVSGGQINFQIPEQTAPGPATVRVLRSSGSTLTGSLQVDNVTPGLFTANASGEGAPAAFFLRVAGDGTQTQALVFDAGTRAPVPIGLGPADDQVFLLLFGTGIRRFTGGVTASVGGLNVPVLGAVPQGEFVGLDQVNIGPLPRALTGRGNVDVLLTVDGIETNLTTVNIR